MNVMGMIYIMQIISISMNQPQTYDGGTGPTASTTTTTTTTTNTNTNTVQMTIQQKWDTGRIHPTSCCCYGGSDGNTDTIYIGYQSGYIECWSLQYTLPSSSMVVDHSLTEDDGTHVVTVVPLTPTLQWRGNFTDEYSCPPPSIASMVLIPHSNNKVAPSHTTTTNHTVIQPATGLVVSLHNDGHHRPNTSAMIEVLDVISIMNAWIGAVSNGNHDRTHYVEISDRSLSLEDFIVLPDAGREIKNILPRNRQQQHQQQNSCPIPWNHWVQSRGTNCLLSTTIPKSFPSIDDTNIIAVGHADGMITILDAVLPTGPDDATSSPVWGVSSSHRRYCSLYPCIGINRIDLSHTNHHDNDTRASQPYLVGCLRGSATYLIPLQPSLGPTDDPAVFALTVPHDTVDDVTIRYTQGFTAGNIPWHHQRYDESKESSNDDDDDSIPVLVYVWPGGVMDVYRCGLLPHLPPSTDEQLLLQELIANGSVNAWRDLILSTDGNESDDTTTNPNWTNARLEIRQHGDEFTPIHYTDIVSDAFRSFRTELLNLIKLESAECGNNV
jgi:hypothetical protein